MHLWHFLSPARLRQKLEYARQNQGELLLHPPEPAKDITEGELSQYIYCLPTIVSGMNFSPAEKLAVIKIKLKPEAKIHQFTGNPTTLSYRIVAKNYDAIDMTITAAQYSGIGFRQILLLRTTAVESWQHSLERDFSPDLEKEWAKLREKIFPATDFFMIDFQEEERKAAARISSHALGLKKYPDAEIKQDELKVQAALKRLGALPRN
jgi:hypothetical protein